MTFKPYTVAEIRAKAEQIQTEAFASPEVVEVWGLTGTHFVLDEGSPTYGRAWRLHQTGGQRPDGSRCSGHSQIHTRVQDAGFLGMTKDEAMTSLMAIQREMYLIQSLTSD